ncbi:hypothetical protein AF72_09970 [Xylella taiwanensis]|uniref:Uncharacterized protein n=1 Tax=Xylella taiwanensis TaxID=1444770 RepID=Z9JHH2_9GAMM|nr:hypothetical protein AB672_08030 [Xylella taiwanensis]EWS77609.1 hypothetical protein AF72_09970 [Xylella taiwanensis]
MTPQVDSFFVGKSLFDIRIFLVYGLGLLRVADILIEQRYVDTKRMNGYFLKFTLNFVNHSKVLHDLN